MRHSPGDGMLVRFLRDVIIMVAVLTALIAIAMRLAHDTEPRFGNPSLENRAAMPPAAEGTEGLAMQPSVSTAAPVQ